MSTTTAPLQTTSRSGRLERRAERRRLTTYDALSARLADLFSLRTLLVQATAIVGEGWIQGAWFSVSTPRGQRLVTAYDLRLTRTAPVTGACLVGAVVEAAGGPREVRSQQVQRSLDLTWHALREDSDVPVRWCPGPDVRMMHVLDLTHWNDAPGRTQAEVVDLLEAAQHTTSRQRDLCLAEQASLDAASVATRG